MSICDVFWRLVAPTPVPSVTLPPAGSFSDFLPRASFPQALVPGCSYSQFPPPCQCKGCSQRLAHADSHSHPLHRLLLRISDLAWLCSPSTDGVPWASFSSFFTPAIDSVTPHHPRPLVTHSFPQLLIWHYFWIFLHISWHLAFLSVYRDFFLTCLSSK